jgi:hypothetical protein
MTEFKIGDRVRYLGVPYQTLPTGTEGVIVEFATGNSGALYANVALYTTDPEWGGVTPFIISDHGPAYKGQELEKAYYHD